MEREVVIKNIYGEFGKPILASSAPGRIDFLNTHQDYKGLPVVPIAVNLRTYIFAVRKIKGLIRIISLNLREENQEYIDEFEIPEIELDPDKKYFGNYFRSVFKLIRDRVGFKKFDNGLEIVVYSEVPIGSGMASSAALEVAFAKLLDEYYGLWMDRYELAELCYRAEREVMRIPCGRLDQYSSSFGYGIVLYPREPVRVEPLKLEKVFFVVVDSGIRHSVADIHPRRQREINDGLRELLELPDLPEDIRRKLSDRYDKVQWEELSYSELREYLEKVNPLSRRRIAYTLLANESTTEAIKIIKEKLDVSDLARIINYQHELLRDYYDVSLPEIEELRNVMLKTGALGVKISGAGLGGCLIGLIPSIEVGEKVISEAISIGAKAGWIVSPDEGARIGVV